MIFAILRAQLLSMRKLWFASRAGSWLSAIPVLAFYFAWTMFAFGAYLVCSSVTEEATLRPALAGGLFGVFLYWQIAPVITASMGASLDLQKLIVYPINLDLLFIVEVMLRFLTVGEMLVMLAGAGLGLLHNPVLGGWTALPKLLLALSLFILFNLLAAAGVRSLIEQTFKRKRMKEIGMLVFVAICAAPGAVVASQTPMERLLPFLPLNAAWPWGAAARAILNQGAVPVSFAALVVWTGAAYFAGRRQFYHALRSDPFAGRRPVQPRAGSGWANGAIGLTGRIWRDPMAAMIEKELRSLSRCAGFRLAFIMGFTFSLLIFFPQVARAKTKPTFMSDHFPVWVSMYSLLLLGSYTFWNAFGYDRTAAQFYFSAPISFRRVLAAKNISALIAQTLEVTLIILIYLILPLPFKWLGVLEAYCVTAIACLYLFALGNVTSVRFPNPIDPDKMSRGSASRGKNALSMLVLPIAFLPIGLAYWGRYVFRSEFVFYVLIGIAAIIGCVFYWIGTSSAIETSLHGREQTIAALSRGQGPLSTT